MKRLILIAAAAGALGACQADRGDVAEKREELQKTQVEARQDVAEERQKAGEDIARKQEDAQEKVADARKDYEQALRSYSKDDLPDQGTVWGVVVKSSKDDLTLRDEQGKQTRMDLADDARVTRDGRAVAPAQIQEGTPVRASFERAGDRIEASAVEMGDDVSREFEKAAHDVKEGAKDLDRDVQKLDPREH